MKQHTEIDLFIALEMFARMWPVTSADLVQNCFRHTGFAAGSHSLPEPGSSVSSGGDNLQRVTQALDAFCFVD